MNILASINNDTIISTIVWLVVVASIWYLLNWLIDYTKVEDPIRKIAKIMLAVFIVLILVSVLLKFTDFHGNLPWIK